MRPVFQVFVNNWKFKFHDIQGVRAGCAGTCRSVWRSAWSEVSTWWGHQQGLGRTDTGQLGGSRRWEFPLLSSTTHLFPGQQPFPPIFVEKGTRCLISTLFVCNYDTGDIRKVLNQHKFRKIPKNPINIIQLLHLLLFLHLQFLLLLFLLQLQLLLFSVTNNTKWRFKRLPRRKYDQRRYMKKKTNPDPTSTTHFWQNGVWMNNDEVKNKWNDCAQQIFANTWKSLILCWLFRIDCRCWLFFDNSLKNLECNISTGS